MHPSSRAPLLAWLALGCTLPWATVQAGPPAEGPTGAPPRRRAAGDDLLAHVPADAPYVLAVLEPAPAGLVRRIEPVLAPLRQAVQQGLHELRAAELDPEARALVEALDGRISATGLRELGLDPNPTFVLHGLGLAPVLRVRLHDGPRLHALLRRIDAADGEPWPIWAVDDVSGWKLQDGDTALAWAIVGHDLVVTLYPRTLETEVLPLAFGARRPSRSLADTGWASAMRREHGLVEHGLGRVDLRALADAWTGRAGGLLGATTRAWGFEPDDDPCNAAIRRAAERMPEVVLGLTALSDDRVGGRWLLRLDRALRRDLAALAGPIPTTADGVASAGFALDMAGAERSARAFMDDLRRAAPGCIDADAWHGVTLPLAIASVRSGAATLHAYDPRKPDDASYTAVLGLSAVEPWLAAALPDASLRDFPRRRPVPARDVLGPAPDLAHAFVARTDDGVAIASGHRARAHARRAARVRGRDRDELFALDLALGGLRRAIPARTLRDGLDDLDPLERALAEGVLDLLGDYEARVRVDDAGLAAEWSLELR